jgi:truncated hemoglobin YjbI
MAAVFVAWAGAMAYWLWPRGRTEGRHRGPSPEREGAPSRHPSDVLVPAPRIGGVTLRDWLIHHCHRDNVWQDVVTEFYTAAAADPEIAEYFAHIDSMERLQRKFLATLLILTNAGLTVGGLDAMRNRHAGLNITGDVYDRTILVLAEVLESKGVPGAAIEQLLPAVDLLRGAIVATPVS